MMQQPYPKLGAAGKLLNQNVTALVNDPLFRRADFDRKRSALLKAVSRARQIAKFQVTQERAKGPPKRGPLPVMEETKKPPGKGWPLDTSMPY